MKSINGIRLKQYERKKYLRKEGFGLGFFFRSNGYLLFVAAWVHTKVHHGDLLYAHSLAAIKSSSYDPRRNGDDGNFVNSEPRFTVLSLAAP